MNKWNIVELVAAGMLATALFIAGNWSAGVAWIAIGLLLFRVRELEEEVRELKTRAILEKPSTVEQFLSNSRNCK